MISKVFQEQYLIEYCAPTLASLKMANLFRYVCAKEQDPEIMVKCWNEVFEDKGLGFKYFHRSDGSALIYVYRKSGLAAKLRNVNVQRFLRKYGYCDFDIDQALDRLSGRLSASSEFPHEIGIFLGYPLGDVIGFIENNGKHCKCIGSWKVYCNENEAERDFRRFRKCKDVYQKLWTEGTRSVIQLTVAG